MGVDTTAEQVENRTPAEFEARQSIIAAVLLIATFLNYANRFTITQTAPLIKADLRLSNEDYGNVEEGFGYAFAVGAIVFGVAADLIAVRWLYPAVVVMWSLAGMSTGWAGDLQSLWASRVALGFFEAGHWSCAWRTTQCVFLPAVRTRANSVLQSGASLGAVLTPLVVILMMSQFHGGWRPVFWLVGLCGLPWGALWLASVSARDLSRPVVWTNDSERFCGNCDSPVLHDDGYAAVFMNRRFWVLVTVVLCINTCWHFIRVWMPLTLCEDHEYSLDTVNYFTSAYYAATFVGCLAAGWTTTQLTVRGWSIHGARLATFAACSLLTLAAVAAAFLPAGALMLGSLLVVAFGSLGLFPIYYSLMQEISARHQGKVGGTLAFVTWMSLGRIHRLVGAALDENPAIRPILFAVVAALPTLATIVLWLFWDTGPVRGRRVGGASDDG